MRSKYDHIKVEVENSSESGVRTYRITLKAPEKDLEFTDQLTQKGDRLIRQSIETSA
jgi:hypothetical protein